MIAYENSRPIQSYFEGVGFERFQRLHHAEQCHGVQHALRDGHRQTLQTVLAWLEAEGGLRERSVCDAGCGTGELTVALAQAGARVHAVDFSSKMVAAARQRAGLAFGCADAPSFAVQHIEGLSGAYDAVVCVDVLARYPTQRAIELIAHLSRLTRSRLVVTFTPKTRLDALLLKLGNAYAERHGLPPLYTHRREVIIKALAALGWEVRRQIVISRRWKFYYCCVLQLVRAQQGAGDGEVGAPAVSASCPMSQQC
jgi:magnesium-protoporphyrin O-methyltransferase